ncbi:hypothetical protein MalM25_05690 [Planctomycetes bacterium MalM25]|nr:hypothetical protein MalM25_05690 [Planctomycetes bacterium MalM25]
MSHTLSRLTLYQEPGFCGNHLVFFPSRGEHQPTDLDCWVRYTVGSVVLELPEGRGVRVVATDGRVTELAGADEPQFLDQYTLMENGLYTGLTLIVWDPKSCREPSV